MAYMVVKAHAMFSTFSPDRTWGFSITYMPSSKLINPFLATSPKAKRHAAMSMIATNFSLEEVFIFDKLLPQNPPCPPFARGVGGGFQRWG